jgi:hypothetical protein
MPSSSPTSASTSIAADVIIDPKTGRKLWCAGTIRYTKGALIMLFVWLVFNDFVRMLMEAVKPALSTIVMRDHGASNTAIAFYMGTIGTVWINPVVST